MRSLTPITLGIAVVVSAAAAGSQSAVPHACSLLSDADIARVTGKPNRANGPLQRSEQPTGLTQCSHYALDVALTPRVTPQTFERTRKGQEGGKNVTIEPVSGVGDEAYFYVRARRSTNNVGIIVRTGQYQVALGDLVSSDSVAWFKPKLVELAKLAAAKVR